MAMADKPLGDPEVPGMVAEAYQYLDAEMPFIPLVQSAKLIPFSTTTGQAGRATKTTTTTLSSGGITPTRSSTTWKRRRLDDWKPGSDPGRRRRAPQSSKSLFKSGALRKPRRGPDAEAGFDINAKGGLVMTTDVKAYFDEHGYYLAKVSSRRRSDQIGRRL